MTVGGSALIWRDQEKPIQEVAFGMRLSDEQKPALEGLQEELYRKNK